MNAFNKLEICKYAHENLRGPVVVIWGDVVEAEEEVDAEIGDVGDVDVEGDAEVEGEGEEDADVGELEGEEFDDTDVADEDVVTIINDFDLKSKIWFHFRSGKGKGLRWNSTCSLGGRWWLHVWSRCFGST